MTPKGEHEQRETLTVDVFYPDHPPRTESQQFRRTKHQLIVLEDRPCWACGTREKREVHHMIVEWADADAVDWSEGSRIRQEHPDFDWASFREPADFVDSPYNMRVLCEKHHRARDHGIHMLPFPNWQIQAYKRADFIDTPDDEVTA